MYSIAILFVFLTANQLDIQKAKVGPFEIDYKDTTNQLSIKNKVTGKTKKTFGALTTNPIFSKSHRLLVVGQEGSIYSINDHCEVEWSRELDFPYNPGSILLFGQFCLVDSGPISPGYPSNGVITQEWIKEARSKMKIVAYGIRDGRKALSVPWLDVGTPVVCLSSKYFLSVRPRRPRDIFNDSNNPQWMLELRGVSFKLYHALLLSQRNVNANDLALFLRNSGTNWKIIRRANLYVATASHSGEYSKKSFDKKNISFCKFIIDTRTKFIRLTHLVLKESSLYR